MHIIIPLSCIFLFVEIPGGSDDVKIIRAKGKYFIVPAGFEGEVPEQESELHSVVFWNV